MGYCFSKKLKALVYRLMENGSLHQWLVTHGIVSNYKIYGFSASGVILGYSSSS